MLDIDFFKNVNDTYGHVVGDTVIRKFSNTILEYTRASDMVGRWGGEEFVILCPNTSLDGANKLAKKLLLAIRNADFDTVTYVTTSIGVAAYRKEDTAERLIQRVDSYLYKAKDNGRDQFVSEKNSIPEDPLEEP